MHSKSNEELNIEVAHDTIMLKMTAHIDFTTFTYILILIAQLVTHLYFLQSAILLAEARMLQKFVNDFQQRKHI